jgi:hypothetical protein
MSVKGQAAQRNEVTPGKITARRPEGRNGG